MGIAWLYGSIRPICLNAVIVRMRAVEIGLAVKRTHDGVLRERGSKRPSLQELRLGQKHTSDEEGGWRSNAEMVLSTLVNAPPI